MPFVKPQLASPRPTVLPPGEWIVEEKFDGHRLILEVQGSSVRAWSRNELPRLLPPHVRSAAAHLADGVYDGELLVPGHRSYGVTELINSEKLVYVVFDLLTVFTPEGQALDVTPNPWITRRTLLEEAVSRATLRSDNTVRLSETHSVRDMLAVAQLAVAVWQRDGEGLIAKRTDAPYLPGKRPKHWFKVKALRTAILEVRGYIAGLLGPYSTVLLRDLDGNETTVKTRNTAERERLASDPESFIGRKLRIEFQERTPDGNYRHPRWDRWENE